MKNYHFNLIVLAIALSSIGVLAVGSAMESLQIRQLIGVILGVIIMVGVSFVDYHKILKLYRPLYILNIILLLGVHFFGVESHNARRWLQVGPIRFQPSDLTKIIVILFFAQFLSLHRSAFKDSPGFKNKILWQAVGAILPSLILVKKQPNLSNTICIALIFCILLYLAGLQYRLIGRVLIVVVPLSIIFLSIVVRPNQKLIEGYQRQRIMAWLEPEKYQDSTGYQQKNSIMAIGSGQLKGKGLNNNTTTSVKKGNFISEPHTDFIFAIIGEELGFVGCCLVIILLLLIVIECILIGMRSKDIEGQLVCGGVAALIGCQTFINIAVATGILPNTGLSLPFVSYGLTSLECMFASLGFVLNVGLQPKK